MVPSRGGPSAHEGHGHGGAVPRQGPQGVAEAEPAGRARRGGLRPQRPHGDHGGRRHQQLAPVGGAGEQPVVAEVVQVAVDLPTADEPEPDGRADGGREPAGQRHEGTFAPGALGHLVVALTPFLRRQLPLEVSEEPLPPHVHSLGRPRCGCRMPHLRSFACKHHQTASNASQPLLRGGSDPGRGGAAGDLALVRRHRCRARRGGRCAAAARRGPGLGRGHGRAGRHDLAGARGPARARARSCPASWAGPPPGSPTPSTPALVRRAAGALLGIGLVAGLAPGAAVAAPAATVAVGSPLPDPGFAPAARSGVPLPDPGWMPPPGATHEAGPAAPHANAAIGAGWVPSRPVVRAQPDLRVLSPATRPGADRRRADPGRRAPGRLAVGHRGPAPRARRLRRRDRARLAGLVRGQPAR